MGRPPVPSNMTVVSSSDGAAVCRIDLVGKDGEVATHAWVDVEDMPLVEGFRWYRNCGYVKRSIHWRIAKGEYGRRTVMLHNHLLGRETGDGEVDHEDGNPLNNRRSNLRPCTHAQNMQNRRKQANTTSRYRGVFWNPINRNWRAKVTVSGQVINLGTFADEDAAGRAAIAARAKLHTHATN